MRILGISCYYHDAAACLVRDGVIVAAAEEERFTRRKHDSSFPTNAIRYCLEAGEVVPEELDHVVFYEKPLAKFDRIVSTYAATFPRSGRAFTSAMRSWLGEKLWIRSTLRQKIGYSGSILFCEHHLSHAASAFYPSPFEEAAVVTADGVGEWTTTTLGIGRGTDLELTHELRFPHSLGLLYSAFTAYLGFEVNEGEYKVMGMAAYGRPRYEAQVRKLIDVRSDGSFNLDMRYFAYHRSLRALSDRFVDLFGPPRVPESDLDEKYADIAASIQKVTEDTMLLLAQRARELTGARYLCLAGGVALNVLGNAKILREAGFEDVWVQPAAGDSGGSVGAALYVHYKVLGNPRVSPMADAYLGPSYRTEDIVGLLRRLGIAHRIALDAELPTVAARALADGKVVGWFQGRMEFGPRSLGARSILADPTDPSMKDRLNAKIKHREQFRPFAPSVTEEAADEHFDFGARNRSASPFMLLVAKVRRPDLLPAITHADGTARVQTVKRDHNPVYYDLLKEFGRLRGVPVLINTSFNLRGEPIVCSPRDALITFAHSDIDLLFLGNAVVGRDAALPTYAYPGSTSVFPGREVTV